jgi:uncharacterized protein (DUF1697 family)
MDRYIAFLRGVNLGKNRRIANGELKAEFERLGFEQVAPFQTSGNVVFSSTAGGEEALRGRIEAGLEESFGHQVTVFLRSTEEVAEIATRCPFDPNAIEASKGKLQVSLLMKKPSAAARRKVVALSTEDDLLAVEGRELYWLPSGGLLDSALDLKAIADAFGLDTRRTMGTIERIVAKHCS